MKRRYYFTAIAFASICAFSVLNGCKSNVRQSVSPEGGIAVEVDSIAIQRIDLENVTTTYEIESSIRDKSICVIDKYLCTLNCYEPTGCLQSSYLGMGHALNETTIGRIAGHTFLPDGRLVIFNTSAIYMLYNEHLRLQDWFRIDYGRQLPKDCYDMAAAYTQRYNRLVCRSFDNCIYCNVELATQETNMLVSGEEFLKRASNVMEIDVGRKALGQLLVTGYPDSYFEAPLSRIILSSSNSDIDAHGNFYVTYEADSLIYVYDKDHRRTCLFGFSGRNMDTDYMSTPTLSDVRKNYANERKRRGYYNWMEYDDINGLLFRSYQKGEGEPTDGLQVYRGCDLIADLDVPKQFRVMGYIEPYYYSNVVADEEAEKLYIYRFSLCRAK